MNLHNTLKAWIAEDLRAMQAAGELPADMALPSVSLETPRDAAHGEVATNIAMALAKPAGKAPPALAALLCARLKAREEITAADVAGPGFINLRLSLPLWREELRLILTEGENYGTLDLGRGQIVNIEYVSANPTGPMHVGHARNAAFGDALANLLAKAGYKVVREYYINDAGAQVDVLARSAHLRYREALGEAIGEIPSGLYPGDYLIPVGAALAEKYGRDFLGREESFWLAPVRQFAIDWMLAAIKQDLARLGVRQDVFTSERAVVESGKVEETLEILAARGLVYHGILEPPKGKKPDDWEPREQLLFRATQFGDDMDRPLKKSDGSYAYFAPDIAHHYDKWKRGDGTRAADLLITVVGADHGGWVKRITAATTAVSDGKAKLSAKLYALINLLKGGEPYRMSKRRGDFVTFSDVVDEVGPDVLRFIMLTRRHDQTLDFDFQKVTEQSRDNPVFYVQYAHARCCSILRHAAAMFADAEWSDAALARVDLSAITAPEEIELIKTMAGLPRLMEQAALSQEPHRIAFWLYDLASVFHGLWNKGKDDATLRFLSENDRRLSLARAALVRALALTIASGLRVLGVTPLQELRG